MSFMSLDEYMKKCSSGNYRVKCDTQTTQNGSSHAVENGSSQTQQSGSSPIKDSGNRTVFETGAVRDIQDDKGRCDLLPLDVVAEFTEIPDAKLTLLAIEDFKKSGNIMYLKKAIRCFCDMRGWTITECLLEVSIHYRDGAKKYGPYNWQKGINVSSYISSGIRHLMRWLACEKDERHDRAFVWNMLGAIWTVEHKPSMIDIPFELLEKCEEE